MKGKRKLPEEADNVEKASAPGLFWSGTISFGLVGIPVSLFPANRASGVHARALGPEGTPLSRRYFSSKTDRELSPKEMVRGYEIEKDKYVVVTDEELDRLAPKKSRDIDLRQFVDVNQISPIYFERGYFLAPDGDSTKAYRLLAAILEKTQRAGIATFVMRGKEYLIAITAENGILRAETMRFLDELRSPSGIGLPARAKAPAEMTRHFIQIIQKRTSLELSQDELRDETSAELLKLVQEKLGRKQGVVVTRKKEGSGEAAPDLVAVLKQSLAGHTGQRPKHSRARNGRAARRPHRLRTHFAKRAAR
jgi:DNA end-binding protein Ku